MPIHTLFLERLPCSILHSCILASILFIIPLRKRSKFALRLILGIVLALITVAVLPGLRIAVFRALYLDKIQYAPLSYLAYTFTDVVPVLLLSFGLILLCCNIQPHKALYSAALAHLTQGIAFTVFNLVFPNFYHRPYDAGTFSIFWREYLIAVAVYAIVYFIIVRKLVRNGTYHYSCVYALLILLAVIFADRYFAIVSVQSFHIQGTPLYQFLLLQGLLVSVLLLLIQANYRRISKYRADLAAQEQMQALQQKEYNLFQKNMDALNHKFHDLRHLINALQLSPDANANHPLLQELQEHIDIHSCFIDTHNDTLNALLSGVWLRCGHEKIQWTCMADGTALDFMPALDLYILLENALDNAMESTALAPDPGDRFLSVNISKAQQFAYIRIENFCAVTPKFSDGLPLTTKPDKSRHGYGTRSIRNICEKYNGRCRMRVEGNLFITELLLPIPREAASANEEGTTGKQN